MILNEIRVEDGSLTFAHGPALTANTVTVTGGTLTSYKTNTIGTLDLQGGTTTLTRGTTVTTAFKGSGSLIADGSFHLDLSTAAVGFDGSLRVMNTIAATSGNLTVITPPASIPDPNLTAGFVGYWPLNEGSGATAFDQSPNNKDGAITGAAWDSFTIGFYRDLQHYAEPSKVSAEEEDRAAKAAGFESRNHIGSYLRQFLSGHHDTLGSVVR